MSSKKISQKQLAEYMAMQKALNGNKPKKRTTKRKSTKRKTKKKSDGGGLGLVVVIALFACAGYFLTGCSYHPECDQTNNGRGNIPASCRGVVYRGEH